MEGIFDSCDASFDQRQGGFIRSCEAGDWSHPCLEAPGIIGRISEAQ